MTAIYGTNIVVDNFRILLQYPLQRFVFFLTHMHADHYIGMTNYWNHGPIYCSPTTKLLLMNKFKVESPVITLPLNTPSIIYLNQSKSLSIEVTFFDSNHCPGSIMILFRGHMGTILHTGDMRFDEKLIYSNPILYPKELRNKDLRFCSIPIDELIFDNTFCDPVFQFGTREEAVKEIMEVIDDNRDCRILISIDSLGKEDLLIQLAEHYQTPIVVNPERYRNIKTINLRPEIFTTNYYEGWIEVIRKKERSERLLKSNEKCIVIVPTGWGNGKKYFSHDKRTYIISYSLHSNFKEIEAFVRSIGPASLIALCRKNNENKKWEKIQEFSNYLISLMHYQQKGYVILAEKYLRNGNFSSEYQNLRNNSEFQKKLQLELGITLTESEVQIENKKMFEKKYQQILQPRKKINKGLKIMVPENNPFLERHELDQLIRNQKNEAAFIIIDTPLKESIIEEEAIEKDLKTLRKPSKAIDSDLEEEFNRPLVGGSKGGILEDWMINSLLPMESTWNNEGIKEKLGDIERNYEGIKEKGIESDYRIKNEEISKENEKKEEIHKIKEEIEEIFKENNNNSLCINNTNEQNARYKFKMNRFLENKHLRSLLKARKNDKKRDLKEKIEKVFKKNKVSKDFFIDARVIDSIMKNIRKISNILKKY